MENKIVLVDTSILIDYYRKTDKYNSIWMTMVRQGYNFAISAISKYEIYSGANISQMTFWEGVLQTVKVLSLDEMCVDTAVAINSSLKLKRKQIDLADLLIAATSVGNKLPLATLNRKHFERIDALTLLKL